MAILRSMDGRFYRIPDEEAGKFLVPADKVEETLRAAGAAQPQAAAPAASCAPMGASAPSVIIIAGGRAPQDMPMGGPQQFPAAQPRPSQMQAYHWHHGPHGWWGGYYNYYNYANYRNYFGW